MWAVMKSVEMMDSIQGEKKQETKQLKHTQNSRETTTEINSLMDDKSSIAVQSLLMLQAQMEIINM